MADLQGATAKATSALSSAAAAGRKLSPALRFLASPRRGLPLVAAVLLGLLVWHEYAQDPQVDVARTWNDSIERLGIRPLFPPQEDFHVGDVFAVLKVSDADALSSLTPTQRALVNKSIRIGYSDPSADIDKIAAVRPGYARRVVSPALAAGPGTSQVAVPPDDGVVLSAGNGRAIALRAMLFPGIVMDVHQGLSFPRLFSRITGRADRSRVELITIDKPRTYGIDPEYAAAHLWRFCKFGQTGVALQCSEQHLRYLLSLQYGPDACARTSSGRHLFEVQIALVSRIYVSQNINVGIGSQRAITLRDNGGQPSAPSAPQQPAGAVAAAGQSAPAAGPSSTDVAGGPARSAAGEAALHDGRRILIAQSGPLEKPIAFGFQAASVVANPQASGGTLSCPERS
ncbi:MAG: hypothetical protein ACT6XY_18035 [Phreatobacter sp.]|uniref:hypothetical protein n=1 Tax=Phreatobacter sp. TaxID=1966341 RepID=UPI0040369F88